MQTNDSRKNLAALSLGALGVVYGDIGTSPLYTMKEVFAEHTGVPLDPQHIIGVVSVIFWALLLIVTLKYVVLILRANNRGEGGIMAMTALAAQAMHQHPRRRKVLLLVGVLGAALFYGDSLITPAISVLSAIEGIKVVAPGLDSFVLPICVAILVALFLVQRFGTSAVGKLFGPIIGLWFGTLAVTGLFHIFDNPIILAALNPLEAIRFIDDRGLSMFLAFGSVVLALTGAEALYADMGHFGKAPIRLAWFSFVLPALALNYLGQGALLIGDPGALANPFFHMFSEATLIPAVVLATLSSIIASQAVISGAYSMTRQAMQLGFLPRMQVCFTSAREAGQIYMPQVNRALLVGVLLVTLGFGSSSALASAYGIAVTVTMLMTTILTYFVVRHGWGYPPIVAIGATGLFLIIDVVLVTSCSLKLMDGGWFPLVLGAAIFTMMATWKKGRELLLVRIRKDDPELIPFVQMLCNDSCLQRVPRTAVYTVANPDTVPQALTHNLKHNRVLHEQNVILTVVFDEVPWVAEENRVEVEMLDHGFWRVRVNYGFKDSPDIPYALELCKAKGLEINQFETSYFLSRETVVPASGNAMPAWQEHLFAAMSRNAGSVIEFFGLPNNAVIELGTRVQI
ncbi:putative potassium transport system protein kup [Pigmentiphaga litoralis]|jgi:KUP system potassium uptake protein|uniref:potassium transporter Kup n=1 Tax=Pigmentiphaga litoralis TaxID=516702 RepID=UPI001677A4A7|nr:potassium transporter Kup [Pigmentiphaga litoralis]GGX21866.1 putative potassium transport system protein kup [Pigmentiphaga litoralis]